MIIWTVEESNLISCYWKEGDSISDVRAKIYKAFPYMNPEMQQLSKGTVRKMESIPEKQFQKMRFDHSENTNA